MSDSQRDNKIEDIIKKGAEEIIEKTKKEVDIKEATPEQVAERQESQVEARETVLEEIEKSGGEERVGGLAGTSNKVKQAQRRKKEIESVLEKDMEGMFINLSPEKQKEFKKVGEETAKKISILLGKTKVKVGSIIKLIKKWLSVIPGINKFFLEQESKIKADEIIKIKQDLDR